MKLILRIFLCFYPFFFLSAQEKVIHFNTSNGLPHDITYGIFQDRSGFIWIGTDDGLVKYDGQEFKLFSTDEGLRNNFVIDVNQSRNGDILVATWGGGLHVIRNDKVLKLNIPNDENEKINNLQIWNNTIIVKHTKGNILYEPHRGGFIKKLIAKQGNQLKTIKEDRSIKDNYFITVIDNIPFLLNDIKSFYLTLPTEQTGLLQLEQGRLQSISKKFEKRVVNSISKIDANTYAVTILDSLFLLGPKKMTRHHLVLDPDKKIICKVQKIDQDTYVVLASDKKGYKSLTLFNRNFKNSINLQKILKTQSSVSDFLIDNENNIWVTTNGDGVYCYNKNIASFKNYTDAILPETLILDIQQKGKKNYLLSPNYLMLISDGQQISKTKLGGIGKKITLIDSANLVVSALNIKRNIDHKEFTEALMVNIIHLKNQQNIYINDSIEVECYRRKFPTLKKIINDAIFYQDTLWFATNVGMYFFLKDSKNLIKKSIGSVKLPSEHIRRFMPYKGALWIATNKGLCRFKDNQLTYYTQENGLISNQINTMLKDHNNKLWIGTNRGISLFDGTNFINLTTSRGLLSPFINVIFENDQHQIMIGSDKGVTVINNDQTLSLEPPPLLHVESRGNQFQYHVISFNRSNSLVVQYRIDGFKWTTLTAPRGLLNFSKEKKGPHQFQLRAKKQDGIWGYSKDYSFSIDVPWYKDTTIVIFIISLVFLIIVFLVMHQLQKVKRRNQILNEAIYRRQQLEKELTEVRSNIAQDFHDELGNKLARISVISNLAINEVPENHEKLLRQIIQIENDTNSLYKGTKDFIFSLKDNSNNIEELVTYLSDFGEDLFSNTSIRFIVQKNIQSDQLLPHYWSKQLIFIFKEALTNVLKHSQCNMIVFGFSYTGHELVISCQDNGVGISEEQIKKASNGILNMKKRAHKIGGELQVEALKEQGTTIRFLGKTTRLGSVQERSKH